MTSRKVTYLQPLRLLIHVAVALFLWTSATANAENPIPKHLWYLPEFLSSVDEAANTLVNLTPFFSDLPGKSVQRIVVDGDGIAVKVSETTVQTNSQWIPSSGGSWIGGQYVPYYGGSTAITQTPITEEKQYWISAKNVSRIQLDHFPDLQREYKWGVSIFHTKASGATDMTLRTNDIALAKKFADAFATLAAFHGDDFMAAQNPMGFEIYPEKERERMTLAPGAGIAILSIWPNGPAAAAGLRENDVIVEANDVKVFTFRDLAKIWTELARDKGELVLSLKVFREGQYIPIQLANKNPFFYYRKLISGQKPSSDANAHEPLGISVRQLTDEETKQTGMTEITGIFIVSVDKTSIAEQLGLMPGDYLMEINGSKTLNEDMLRQVLTAGVIRSAKVRRDGKLIELSRVSKF